MNANMNATNKQTKKAKVKDDNVKIVSNCALIKLEMMIGKGGNWVLVEFLIGISVEQFTLLPFDLIAK